jgi:hypothetical protein
MGWQELLTSLVVAAAAVTVARRVYLALFTSQTSACGSGCASCPSSNRREPAILTIGPLPEGPPRLSRP